MHLSAREGAKSYIFKPPQRALVFEPDANGRHTSDINQQPFYNTASSLITRLIPVPSTCYTGIVFNHVVIYAGPCGL